MLITITKENNHILCVPILSLKFVAIIKNVPFFFLVQYCTHGMRNWIIRMKSREKNHKRTMKGVGGTLKEQGLM